MNTKDDILARATRVFQKELDRSDLVLTNETTANDVEDWDSLTHMNLIHAVEEEFGVRFKLPEILKFKNVGDMCEVIEKRLNP